MPNERATLRVLSESTGTSTPRRCTISRDVSRSWTEAANTAVPSDSNFAFALASSTSWASHGLQPACS